VGEKSKTKSAIGIKADAVRIIGRENIKIVTGTDRQNSAGGTLHSVGELNLLLVMKFLMRLH